MNNRRRGILNKHLAGAHVRAEGWFYAEPEVGCEFTMWDDEDRPVIRTSPAEVVTWSRAGRSDVIKMVTHTGSSYELTVPNV